MEGPLLLATAKVKRVKDKTKKKKCTGLISGGATFSTNYF